MTEITPIPENGWTEDDIDKVVRLKMQHGTVIEDTIVFLEIDGVQYIGPANELGGILARAQYAQAAMAFYEDWKRTQQEWE